MGNKTALLSLDLLELRDRLASGAISALEVTEACLDRIAERDEAVQAWAWIDPDFARDQARRLDTHRKAGRPLGALHGLPVGVKDVIDTAKVPTENGCPLDAGRVPLQDAFVVERLKQAGAVILGKTVTTELAFMHAGKTRNPHHPDHTPGGSSSGSAAAVADLQVPLAIGTQTGGSVIRPASYCGVTGFKPSFGTIPRRGVLMQSPSLDTVGVFARTPLDAALLAEVLFGHDPQDSATSPAPVPRLLDVARTDPPVKPLFALIKPPGWAEADPQLHEAFAELTEALGDQVFEAELPAAFSQAAALREQINFAEMARCYYRYGRDGMDLLGPRTRDAMDKGAQILARDYLAALDWRAVFTAAVDEVFERCDAILCPAATGPAPKGLEFTGNAIFNGLWTMLGTPAITIPAFTAENGLPMGLQLVGPCGQDARLLRNAHWFTRWLDAASA